MIGQVWARLRLMLAQGVGTLIGAEFVQVRVFDDEVLPKVRRVEPYGFSYRPKSGSQVYMMFPSGDRSQGIALLIGDKRYQMDLLEGEVALHDDDGNFVKMGRGGIVSVKAKTKILQDAPVIEFVGKLIHNGKEIGSPHTHTSTPPGQPTSGVI
jgi:phage gp45-like